MIIPYTQLDAEVLANVLQDIASREGTDYGEIEISLEEKVVQLRLALQQKRCFLVFDAVTEALGLMSIEDAVRSNLL